MPLAEPLCSVEPEMKKIGIDSMGVLFYSSVKCTGATTHGITRLDPKCMLLMSTHVQSPEHSQGSAIEVLGSPNHGCGTVCPLNCDSKTFASPSLGGYLRQFYSLRLGTLWLLCFNGAGYKHSYLLTYVLVVSSNGLLWTSYRWPIWTQTIRTTCYHLPVITSFTRCTGKCLVSKKNRLEFEFGVVILLC